MTQRREMGDGPTTVNRRSSVGAKKRDRCEEATQRRPVTRRWTTIVLEETPEGWLATQTGVDVEGRGETAADAAAAYCRRVSTGGTADAVPAASGGGPGDAREGTDD